MIHNLPQPDCGHFVGRDDEKQTLIELLRPHPYSPHYVVTILGVGGVGKTALALEIASHYLYSYKNHPINERFQAVVWFSAKETVLSGNQILPRWPSQKTITDLYETIAEVFNVHEVQESDTLEDKDRKIRQILKNQRTLLILDNLETVKDERLLDFILHPPIPTKIIVTTRHWVSVAFPLKLEGMPYIDALNLIDRQCQIGNVTISDDEKEKLVARTGGIPLALVWSIGLVRSGMPIATVLNLLGNASSSVAKFIFETSINQIRDTPAISLLSSLALFLEYASDYKVREYANRDELGNLSRLSAADRDEGLAVLYQLSLVSQTLNQFSLLPLTKSFVLDEIVSESAEATDEDLRIRVNNYVFGLSQHTPFIYGTPVSKERFLGRQREIRRIANRLLTSQSSFIIGEPRSGKTSLLQYIANADEIEQLLVNDKTSKVVKIELNASDISTPTEFWKFILIKVNQAVGNETFQKSINTALLSLDDSGIFHLERVFKELEKENWKIIVFLDEIEHFFSNLNFQKNAQFWGVIRSFASRFKSLQLLITSAFSLSDLNRLTADINPYGSPYFNIYDEIILRPFNLSTAKQLITEALQASQIKYSEKEVNMLTWLSGNHPYRLQVAGSTLFDVKSDSDISTKDTNSLTIQQYYERTINHFDDLWERHFSEETKIILLYVGLIDVIKNLNKNIPGLPKLEIDEFRYEFRELETTGWIQANDDSSWQISVGGYLLWLIDMVNFRTEKGSLKSWVMATGFASKLLSLDDWAILFDKLESIQSKDIIENFSQSIGKRFE